MHAPLWLWIAFNLGVLVILALDLGVFHRKAHATTMREAAMWTTVWVTLSALFAASLIDADEGELVEFKQTVRWSVKENKLDKDVERSAVKTVAAFLNSHTRTS